MAWRAIAAFAIELHLFRAASRKQPRRNTKRTAKRTGSVPPNGHVLSLAMACSAGQHVVRAMEHAYRSIVFTMIEIGKHFGVSDKTVSRAVRRYEF
jgi:hypothetical protein